MKVPPRPENAPSIEGAEMPQPWSSRRVHPSRSEKPKILSTRPSTALVMAATLISTIISSITKLLGPRIPTTQIAGAALTHDEAVQLDHTCTAIRNALNLQLGSIGRLPSSKEHIVLKLRRIQDRHIDINIHLSTVVTEMNSSDVLWVLEFADAQAALQRKIAAINRRSRELEWTQVAQQCWLIVAVTYGWLLPLVLRLQGELQRALKRPELWAIANSALPPEEGDGAERQELAALYTHYPRVHFEKEAIVQGYLIGSLIGEQYVGKPSTAVLSDDQKRTARKFKGKKTKFRDSSSDLDAQGAWTGQCVR